MTFGLSVTMLATIAGGAIDIGRWLTAKSQVQQALDAAVLAGGRVLLVSRSEDAAIQAAMAYYTRLTSKDLKSDHPAFEMTDNGMAMRGRTLAVTNTPILSLIGINQIHMQVAATAELPAGAKSVEDGGPQRNLELSLMLDVTGSMAGSKITELKSAATRLLEIVIPEHQPNAYFKAAIVPFAPRVNVGEYFEEVTGFASSRRFGGTELYPIGCVTERTGSEAYTDAKPSTSDRRLGAYNGDTGTAAITNQANYSTTGNCSNPGVDERIVPLTSDVGLLKSRVDQISASGSTAGQLGTAWAWYLLSPKWNGIWQGGSQPAPYNDLGPNGKPKTEKIAVLMSDGIYNTYKGTSHGDTSSMARTISSNAVRICQNMRAAGIAVFTIGFQLGQSALAIDTLRQCASTTEMFYNVNTGSELSQAFEEIGLQIGRLRLRE